MTLVNIDLRNQGYETGPDDRVIFYSLLVREGDFGTISTAPVEVELVDGKATVDLAPGPVGVQIIAGQVADTRVKIGEVPPSGPTTLGAVMMVTPAYTPALQQMMIAAIERAKEVALDQVDGAVSIAVDAEVGEAIYTATSSAALAASSATVAQQSASSAEARAASAESGATNAVSRVAALEAMSGLSPESPADGQTANLVAQPNTLTRQSLNAAIQSGMNAVSVRDFGAKGDGTTDDTTAIQSAIDWIASRGGGDVIVPGGIYMIKSHVEDAENTAPLVNFLVDQGGIGLKDGVHLRMAQDATLQAIPNDKRKYIIVRIYDKRNVAIYGGNIKGERTGHLGTGGEWGYGIAISGGRNIHIEDVRVTDCWGDGINLQASKRPDPLPQGYVGDVPQNVSISRVTCSNNRRQGMSIEGVIDLIVSDSIFELTHGTAPAAGVDIEPMLTDKPTQKMRFERCTFRGNDGCGMTAWGQQIQDLTIVDCLFDSNKESEAQLKTYTVGSRFNFHRNVVTGTPESVSSSILMQGGTDYHIVDNVVDSRIMARVDANGIGVRNIDISGNRVDFLTGSPGRTAIYTARADNVTIRGNSVNMVGASSVGLRIDSCADVWVQDNEIWNADTAASIQWGAAASIKSRRVTFSGNRLYDNRLGVLGLVGVSGLEIFGNIVYGPCHGNDRAAAINYFGSVDGVRLIENVFHQAPLKATGTGRALRVISWAGHGLDTVARGNRTIPDGEATFPLWGTSQPRLTSGYMGGENGLMVAPSSARPSDPTAGMQVFDTSLGKVVVYSGAEWVNLDGSPLATP